MKKKKNEEKEKPEQESWSKGGGRLIFESETRDFNDFRG